MRVLGIDPGSNCTGWGLLGGGRSAPEIIRSGIIRLDRRAPFAARLGQLQVEFREILKDLSPDSASVEAPYHGVNPRSALQLAHARGVLLACLGEIGVPVSEYPPATVKKAVTGNGRADKSQVKAMVGNLLGAVTAGQPDDLTDALAVAYTHMMTSGFAASLRPERQGGGGR